MQLEALYDNGSLKFLQPVSFLRQRFTVKVEIPEQEIAPNSNIDHASDLSESAQAWLKQLDSITQRILTMPEDELPELTAKQIQYMDAFQLHEDQ